MDQYNPFWDIQKLGRDKNKVWRHMMPVRVIERFGEKKAIFTVGKFYTRRIAFDRLDNASIHTHSVGRHSYGRME